MCTLIICCVIIFTVFPIDLANGSISNYSYELLIVGLEAYRSVIQRFIDFKQSQGVAARFVSIEYVNASVQGPDIVRLLHEFVASEYRRSGIKYLLLIGTYDEVPTKYVYSPSYEYGFADFNYKPTDWYYGVPDWTDSQIGLLGGNIPTIAVGRLPVSNEEELNRTISKIIELETHPSRGLFLIFSGLNMTFEPTLSFSYTYYSSDSNSTSEPLSQILSGEVAYTITYTHGSPSALWTRATDGEWETLMTNDDVSSIEATYNIQYLVACFAGALDLENGSLARSLIISSEGPALVIASSRTESYDNEILSGFWENFFSTEDVGSSILEALQSYLSDQTVFNSQNPMFQEYNFYLDKVVYGDISWTFKDPKENIIVNSTPPTQPKPSALNGNEAQTRSENPAQLTNLTTVVPLFAALLCSAFASEMYKLRSKKRINRKGQPRIS